MRFRRRHFLAGLVAIAPITLAAWQSASQPAQQPSGPVLLTIGGKIGTSNRGPAMPDQPGFFKHHSVAFERALALDAAMLSTLPQQTLALETGQAGNGAFSGPSLKAVMALAAPQPASLRLMSLDGFAVELGADEAAAKDWLLATAKDGKPFGIGDFGPVWLMHTPANGKTPSEEELQRWVWSVFYIEVM